MTEDWSRRLIKQYGKIERDREPEDWHSVKSSSSSGQPDGRFAGMVGVIIVFIVLALPVYGALTSCAQRWEKGEADANIHRTIR